MKVINNFFYGIVFGAAGTLPGFSSGIIAVVFGFFDEFVEAFSNIFKDFKKSALFLTPFFLGQIAGVFLLAKGLIWLMERFPIATPFAFMGLIAGSIPLICSKATASSKKIKLKDIIPCVSAFVLITAMTFFTGLISNELVLSKAFSFETTLKMFGYGMISGVGPIIPGVSGSLMVITFGGLNTYLSTIHAANDLNFAVLVPFAAGIIVSVFLISKLLKLLMDKHLRITYFVILGFVLASFVSVYPGFNADAESIAAIFVFILFAAFFVFLTMPQIKRVRLSQLGTPAVVSESALPESAALSNEIVFHNENNISEPDEKNVR